MRLPLHLGRLSALCLPDAARTGDTGSALLLARQAAASRLALAHHLPELLQIYIRAVSG